MGVRQELREVYGEKYDRDVNRVAGINKFTSPALGKHKLFKIREPMKIGEYNNFVQYVDEVQEVNSSDGTKTYAIVYDGKGKPRENLPHNLTEYVASQIEGQLIKALSGRDPDDDLNVSRGSIWKITGVVNPKAGPTPDGRQIGDTMNKLELISLDGNIVGQILAGIDSSTKTQITAEDQTRYT